MNNCAYKVNKMTTLAIVLLSAAVCGCDPIGCGGLSNYVNDPTTRGALTEWADKEIFSREFIEDDFQLGRLVGPGRGRAAFATLKNGIYVPKELSSYELRAIGVSKNRASAVFFGIKSYRGIVVSRNSIHALINEGLLSRDDVVLTSDRVALLCYRE